MTFLIDTKDFSSELFQKVQLSEKILTDETVNKSKDRHSFLGRVLLSYVLYKKGFAEKLSFTYGENGKPYLKNGHTFFNISHSGNYVLLSISGSEIGCDVQTVGKYNPRIAERFFTEDEKILLEKSKNQSRDFTRLWAMKESVLKKTGDGITAGLNSVCFASCLQKNDFIKFGYHFKVNELADAFVCICSDAPENEITGINKEEIENYTDTVMKGEL